MRHRADEDFWTAYAALPADVRKQADRAFGLLKADSRHPSLHFKKVGERWSARVGRGHRALALETGAGARNRNPSRGHAAFRRAIWYRPFMTLSDAIATLRRHEPDLRARGVRHAAVFGSVARNEFHPGSDLDILVDIDASAMPDVFAYAALKRHLAELFEARVDVVNRRTLKPHVRASALTGAVDAF